MYLSMESPTLFIYLENRTCLSDISATNIVSSNRLADAQIRYTGSGHLADTSKPGWLSQFMRAVSPF